MPEAPLGSARFLHRMPTSSHGERPAGEALQNCMPASGGDAVVTTDRDGLVVFLDRVAEQLTGWSNEDARGQPIANVLRLVDESTRATVDGLVTRACRECVTVRLTNRTLLIRKDGRELPVEASAIPVLNSSGAATAIIALFRDQTPAREQESSATRAEGERQQTAPKVDQARAHIAAVLENSPVFMCTLRGPQHVFELVNSAYQTLVGDERKLIGRPVAEALPEVSAQGFLAILDRVYESGQPFHGSETPIRLDRNGNGYLEDAFVSFVYQPARSASGAIAGIDAFGFDVTEQVRARRQVGLLASAVGAREEELRAVTDAIPLLVSFVTHDGRYGIVNKAYEEWFGQRREELVGQKVRDVIGEAAWSKLGASVERGLAGERFDFEMHSVAYRAGGSRDVKVSFVPRHDVVGNPHGYVALIEDITTRRRLEQEREAALARISEMLTFERQLIGIVSHDLRNPLNVIVLSANLLARSAHIGADVASLVARIQRASDRATHMVSDLLDFTQARLGGGLQVQPRHTELTVVLHAVTNEIELAFPARRLEIDEEPGLSGQWDPGRLAQVFQNLITNALKYSFEYTPVRIVTRREGTQAAISVHNVGEPIAASKLATVFEPFERAGLADSSTRSVGLGLHIVRQVVNAHHGTVDVQSSEAEGTTFTVRLACANE